MLKRQVDVIRPYSAAIFQTTCWRDIQSIKTTDQAHQRAALAMLTERYWKPVYWFLRRKGYSHERAHDLTQGFFLEIVLGHGLFELADQSKGRFRTFLLAALIRYTANQHRYQTAGKRAPKGEIVSLEACPAWQESTVVVSDPEQIFMYAWATDVLDRVMGDVQQEFCSTGRDVYWKVFCARVVTPIVMEAREPSLGEVRRTYGIETEKMASNMIVTVKRRFRSVLKRILAEGVTCESDIEEEIGELISILSRAGVV